MRDMEQLVAAPQRPAHTPGTPAGTIALLLCVPPLLAAQPTTRPPNVPSRRNGRRQAHAEFRCGARAGAYTWRDTPPFDDGPVNAYIEIPRGERTK